ncbi:biotin-dependent carboxyltransferase family protein [Martelella endophytica]|uniref:Allophanate hydrolase n=1 Tax=Martelella endophytica TaxID=1486262 RepID=A0A0D5LUA9_MAREN|nr:biotin-dependent carboxyltransferase family protein [Martelella endophytica]AJY47646.1 allophanate hydrolase [Martelella endophytica]
MTTLEVLRPGLAVSVQSRPRYGYLAAGVSPSGAMDEAAFRIAKALVGNGEDAAALEFAQFGGSYRVDRPTLIAVTGGAVEIRIDGERIPAWESRVLPAGVTLEVGSMRGAVWGYIAFSGGIDVPEVMGSRSTHLRTGIGGFQGRTLAAGDRLSLGEAPTPAPRRLAGLFRQPRGPIRVIAGPQAAYFDSRAWASFLGEDYTVSRKRDRMASLLDGPWLTACRGHDIVSDGTPAGSIQVPGSGQPMVLTAERQTTGGYPKIATVISADLARLAQMPSGVPFRFRSIDRDEAEDILIADARRMSETIDAIVR